MEKEFKTINEQVELLKSRNLLISNTKIAINILKNNNYYYIINGYKDIFLDNHSKIERYIDGTTIEDIYNLYEFDRTIRITFLEYILLIERKIDTYIAYEFSKEHGYKNYLIKQNFDYHQKDEKKIRKTLE